MPRALFAFVYLSGPEPCALVQLTWSICLEQMECDKDERCLWWMLERKERESLTIQTHCLWLY